jgi:hypothetical protein
MRHCPRTNNLPARTATIKGACDSGCDKEGSFSEPSQACQGRKIAVLLDQFDLFEIEFNRRCPAKD